MTLLTQARVLCLAFSISVFGCVGFAVPLHSEIVRLQPAADTTLFETYTNYNLGRVNSLAAGTTARSKRSRALIRFDFTARIPSDAFIRDAWLELEVVRTPSGGGGTPSNFQLHRVLRDWGEGDKAFGATGAPATAGEATWMARFHPTNAWAAPGAVPQVDYAAVPSASQFVEGHGIYRWDFLRSDVQFWVGNPTANFGWILLSDNETTAATARRFASREDTNVPPVLTLDFEIPRPRIVRVERVEAQARLHFQAAPNRTYQVQYLPWLTGSWTLLTNITPALTNRSLIIHDPIASTNRFYRLAMQ